MGAVIGNRVAVAVSGGGDSLALVFLFDEWAKKNNSRVIALTVDHGLREGSRIEAENLQILLKNKNIEHHILTWTGEKPSTHIQEFARQARHDLLYQACYDHDCSVLALAHNAEDQMETFWMRLAHGSGLDGLAAMAPVRENEGISIIRPVLNFTRQQLRATCERFGVAWAEDPSNANERFLRVKLRGFENVLAGEGLTPQRLAGTLEKLSEARQALEEMASRAHSECITIFPEGYAALDIQKFKDWPLDIRRRVLLQVLQTISPAAYAPGFDSVDRVLADIAREGFLGCTLHECEIVPESKAHCLILREFAHVEQRRPLSPGLCWDRRFTIEKGGDESYALGALGEQGIPLLRKQSPEAPAFEKLPFKVKKTLPALWQGENLVAVPHVSYWAPDVPPAIKQIHLRFGGVKVV